MTRIDTQQCQFAKPEINGNAAVRIIMCFYLFFGVLPRYARAGGRV